MVVTLENGPFAKNIRVPFQWKMGEFLILVLQRNGYLHVVLRFTSSIPLENAYHFYQLSWSGWGKRLASLGFLVAL